MKKIGTLLLLVGFVGMAVFGLFVMDLAMGHDDVGCIASRVSGNDAVCPMSLMQMAFHHISAVQAFSLSTVASSFVFLLLFLLFAFAFSVLFVKILSFHPPKFLTRHGRRETDFSFFHSVKITRWLALFEHSPSII